MRDISGKEAVRRRIRPAVDPEEAPSLRFIDWTEQDARQTIRYAFFDTAIGRLLIADTAKGVCFLGFVAQKEAQKEAPDAETLADLRRRFPGQPLEEARTAGQQAAAEACEGRHPGVIPLHLKGTDFQLNIWKKLTRIPKGTLCTYSSLTDDPRAARAVGSAVGANLVSVLIPCHRVVRKDGSFHGYHWGTEIKRRLLEAELE
jgi:AraC family transcriptional regulator of adaptative response/methylated-DNA-[protein]-cysteine methyltransferase